MDWKDIGNVLLKQGLPLLASAIPGGGLVAGPVGSLIANALGLDSAEPDKVAAAIKNDPEAFLKLKQLEADHQVELQKLALQQEQARLEDVQNARKRDMLFIQQGKSNTRANIMLAMAFIFATVVYALLAVMKDMPLEVVTALATAGGICLKMISDAFQFEFGSSRGSKVKDDNLQVAMQELSKKSQ